MSYTTEGIARVRVRPLAIDLAAGKPAASVGAVEVTWDSGQEGLWHQVYVNGCLAGVTAQPPDRRLIVPAPVGHGGIQGLLCAEVVAVDAADRWTDFGGGLSGFAPDSGSKVRLTWQAGLYLDANLDSFDVLADWRTGDIDYATPLNETPIPAVAGGQAPWGFGCGGFGSGGYGRNAAAYEWTSDNLEPGAWRFAVVAADAAGNRLATAAEVAVDVVPVPRPPSAFRLAGYEPTARVATLAWEFSPDV